MSNDTTQNLPNGSSFEERVFARFDALDARTDERFDKMEARQARMEERQERMEARQERSEARLERIETQLGGINQRLEALENKAYDTKPIWERALAEILELRGNVHTLDRKFNILNRDSITLRSDQSRLEDRMDRIDAERA